jgi:hypothetical protein
MVGQEPIVAKILLGLLAPDPQTPARNFPRCDAFSKALA